MPFFRFNLRRLFTFPPRGPGFIRHGLFLSAAGLLMSGGLVVPSRAAEPFTLDAALERVIATDETIGIADYEVRKARVEQLRAFTRVLPNVGVGADANWRGNRTKQTFERTEVVSEGGTDFNADGTVSYTPDITRVVRESRWTRSRSNQQSLGFNFSQPILDFTLGPARRQGELGRKITEWQLRQRLREVLFGVTEQYFEVLRQERLLEENRKTLEQAREQVRQAQARFEVQEVIQSDVLQAQVDYERAHRAVLETENSLARANSQLAVSLSYPPTETFTLAEPREGRLIVDDLRHAVDLAQSQREDVRVSQLTLSRTHAARDGIKARYAPTLDFQFSKDLSTSSTVDRSLGWTAGFGLNWTWFDRGQRELDMTSNRLQIDQDALRIDNTLRAVSNDAIGAWFAIDRLQKQMASLEAERRAAELTYTVQQERYRAGLSTSLEVLTALRDLANARAGLVSVRYELEISYRDLENVLASYEDRRIALALQRLLSPAAAINGAAADVKEPSPKTAASPENPKPKPARRTLFKSKSSTPPAAPATSRKKS